jgi:hypothetical protein
MSKRFAGILLASMMFAGAAAQAQGATFGVGAGGLFYLEEGAGGPDFGATGLVGFGGGGERPIGFRIDGTYVPSSDFADYAMFLAGVVYTFKTSPDSKFHPYLIGGGGLIINFITDDTDLDAAIHAGAGFNYQTSGRIKPFVEARFINEFVTGGSFKMLQVLAGVKFGG